MKSERASFLRQGPLSQRRIPGSGSASVARKRLCNGIDLEKLLHFSQQLYAHALTLQEMIRKEGASTYETLRPRYDR